MTSRTPHHLKDKPTMTYDAVTIAQRLGRPEPTEEQRRVIEADPGKSYLVVAGAGAGKTETMAARVVWLVANGHCDPSEVLGLTFTRKAAGELAERVRHRLRALTLSGLFNDLPSSDPRRRLDGADPVVSTYDSFVSSLVAEFGLWIPVEPETRTIDEAHAQLRMKRLIMSMPYSIPRDDKGDLMFERQSVKAAEVLDLLDEMVGHDASPEDIREECISLIQDVEGISRATKDTRDLLSRTHKRLLYLELIRHFEEDLRRDSQATFSTTMKAALQLIKRPDVVVAIRQRHPVVLLDEYQDTSHSQRVLLSTLFAPQPNPEDGRILPGSSVTAVGDPNQAIYSFRGASAVNLERFVEDFPNLMTIDGADRLVACDKLQLTTSWRNPTRVLELANVISSLPGPEGNGTSAGRIVDPLTPSPNAPEGDVVYGWYHSEAEEVEAVADYMEARYNAWKDEPAPATGEKEPFTAAVLASYNSDCIVLAAALRRRGLPVVLATTTGLTTQPEILAITSVLRLLVDPSNDLAALQLLTSTRWNIGARDLSVLAASAQRENWSLMDSEEEAEMSAEYLARYGLNDLSPTLTQAIRPILVPCALAPIGLAEIMVSMAKTPVPDLSEEAVRRIRELTEELGYLRRHALTSPLPVLIGEIERMTGLRTEALARETSEVHHGTSNLDAFHRLVRTFAEAHSTPPTAEDLIEYLDFVDDNRGGDLGEVEPQNNAINVMTIHKSKGLEFGYVALTGLTSKKFFDVDTPRIPVHHWLKSPKKIPSSLRGDSVENITQGEEGTSLHSPLYPAIFVDEFKNGTAVKKCIDKATKDLKAYEAYLKNNDIYVGLTRAERGVFLSGSSSKDFASQAEQIRTAPRPSTSTLGYPCHVFEAMVQAIAEDPTLGECLAWGECADYREKLDDLLAYVNNLQHSPANDEESREGTAAQWPSPAPLGGHPLYPEISEHFAHIAASSQSTDTSAEHPSEAEQLPRTPDASPAIASWEQTTRRLIEDFTAAMRDDIAIAMPATLTATQAVALKDDRKEFARRLRRPVPTEPQPYAKRGTAFHNWVESHYGQPSLWAEDDMPGAYDSVLLDDDLEQLKERFLASEWAEKTPANIEGAFTVILGDIALEGRVDAVFHEGEDPTRGWTIVDWKTGAIPTGAEREAKDLQLACYRLAWSRKLSKRFATHVPVDNIRAVFHYVRPNKTIEPSRLPSEEELVALIRDNPSVVKD